MRKGERNGQKKRVRERNGKRDRGRTKRNSEREISTEKKRVIENKIQRETQLLKLEGKREKEYVKVEKWEDQKSESPTLNCIHPFSTAFHCPCFSPMSPMTIPSKGFQVFISLTCNTNECSPWHLPLTHNRAKTTACVADIPGNRFSVLFPAYTETNF